MRQALAIALIAAAAVAGCDGSDSDELNKWMAEQRASTKPKVTPIPEPKQFKPESYAQEAQVEPFSKEKLAMALRRDSQQQGSASAALVQPELSGQTALSGAPGQLPGPELREDHESGRERSRAA
jgi:type IV pilus assembly protein PilP